MAAALEQRTHRCWTRWQLCVHALPGAPSSSGRTGALNPKPSAGRPLLEGDRGALTTDKGRWGGVGGGGGWRGSRSLPRRARARGAGA